jgi:hypothetical protein
MEFAIAEAVLQWSAWLNSATRQFVNLPIRLRLSFVGTRGGAATAQNLMLGNEGAHLDDTEKSSAKPPEI